MFLCLCFFFFWVVSSDLSQKIGIIESEHKNLFWLLIKNDLINIDTIFMHCFLVLVLFSLGFLKAQKFFYHKLDEPVQWKSLVRRNWENSIKYLSRGLLIIIISFFLEISQLIAHLQHYFFFYLPFQPCLSLMYRKSWALTWIIGWQSKVLSSLTKFQVDAMLLKKNG